MHTKYCEKPEASQAKLHGLHIPSLILYMRPTGTSDRRWLRSAFLVSVTVPRSTRPGAGWQRNRETEKQRNKQTHKDRMKHSTLRRVCCMAEKQYHISLGFVRATGIEEKQPRAKYDTASLPCK